MQLEGYYRNELSTSSGKQTSLIQETLCYPSAYAKVLHWPGVRGGHSEGASGGRRKSCLELSRDTERFSPAGRFPEEGSPVSPLGRRKLVSPWDRCASSSALYGNCQEEMLVLCHRNPLLPDSAAPTHVAPTGTACTCTVKESLAPSGTLATGTYWKGVGALCAECNGTQGANSDTSDTLQSRKAHCPLTDPSWCGYARVPR